MRTKYLAWLDTVWFPIFLLCSVSWLVLPGFHQTHTGHLLTISSYEATGLAGTYSRIFDVLAATLYGLLVVRVRLWKRDPIYGGLLFIFVILAIIDALCTDGCLLNRCDDVHWMVTATHLIESGLSAVVFFALTVYDWFRGGRRWQTGLLIAGQLIGLSLVLTHVLGNSQSIAAEYFYEAAVFAWLAWFMTRYLPLPSIGLSNQRLICRLFGAWAALSGVLSILLGLHIRAVDRLAGISIAPHDPYLSQHSVIVGVLLLYFARHIAQGQRRAAWLLQLIFVSQMFKYGLFDPKLWPLLASLVTVVLMAYSWAAFDRNVTVLNVSARLKETATIIGGVALALLLFLSLTVATQRNNPTLRDLKNDATQHTRVPAKAAKAAKQVIVTRYNRFHRTDVFEALAVATVAMVAWSLFRPSRVRLHTTMPPYRIDQALQKYGSSSEDYFKYWPAKRYFTMPLFEGFIAYEVSGRVAFALADPVCAPRHRAEFLQAFQDFCRTSGYTVCFIPVAEAQLELYKKADFSTVQIGSSAVVSVTDFATTTMRDKWWRWQLNRATREGMTFETSLPPHNPELLAETRALSDLWLERAGHSEQGFALGYYDETYLQACRLLLLRDANGDLIAFANELPIYNYLSQTTVDLIRFHPDVNGAMPTLIARFVELLEQEGVYKTFDLGFVPLAKLDSALGKIARRLVQARFSAAGLEQFKGKFDPNWEPVYLAYDGDLLDLATVAINLERVLAVDA